MFDETYDNCYFGPMNYFYRVGDSFIHYEIDNYQVDLEEANDFRDEFDEQLAEFRGLTSEAFEVTRTAILLMKSRFFISTVI